MKTFNIFTNITQTGLPLMIFQVFIRKHKSEKIFEKLFKESKNGLSETTQQISENLIKNGGRNI